MARQVCNERCFQCNANATQRFSSHTPYIGSMSEFSVTQQNLFGGLVCNTTRERLPLPFESLMPGQRYLVKEVARADGIPGSLKIFQTRDGFERVRTGKYGQLICTKYLDRSGRIIRVDSDSVFTRQQH